MLSLWIGIYAMTKVKFMKWTYCLFFISICTVAINSKANQTSFNEEVVVLANGYAGPEFDSPIQAYDQALNWNSCSSDACPNIDFGFVDDEDRDHQVLEVSHAATTAGAGVFISSSDAIDMSGSLEGGIYQLDLKVISGDPKILFKVDCGYPCGGGDQYVTVAEQGVWETFSVPVADLIPNGPNGNSLDLEIVKGGLVIHATEAYGTVFRVDNVIWKCVETCEQNQVAYEPVDWASTHEDKAVGYDAPTSYDGYTQVWADEFSGNAIDAQKWSFDIGNGDNGWGNGELQHYRAENASVDNGMLIIEAKKHQPALDGDIRYTSARLKTEDKFHFKYGRVDIRAVMAQGQGLWSAAWMLGANYSQIGWPYSGEIDIVDTIGGVRGGTPQEGMITHNMYWNATGPNPNEPYSPANINQNGSAEYRINASNEGETFSNKFHVFSMIWDEDKIQFQVDGIDTVSVNLWGSLAETYRNPFYLIMNVTVGGAWPGAPDEATNFPDGMLVDYVRVYQKDNDSDGVADYGDYEILTDTGFDWDFDDNGQADALTDGLIMLRYAFGLRGDNLIDGVMAPESDMSAADIELVMQSAAEILDIDLDGEVSALTDGLLLLRYLFDMVDESLVNGVVSPSAVRASIEDITAHLDRYMPSVEIP